MSTFTVAKFGGSSLATRESIAQVARIVKDDPSIRFVVVSAPGKIKPSDTKITDLLLLCHVENSEKQEASFSHTFNTVANRFQSIYEGSAAKLKEELDAIQLGIESGQSADWVASRGEYLNAKVIAATLGFAFVDAAELIHFRQDGRLDEPNTWKSIESNLMPHQHAVIPGFYGILPDEEVKTFPRGGSDITGAIVAAATGAKMYLNFTDVPGFLCADPRLVPDPLPIERLTFEEVRELSWAGARVLHADTVFPARKAGIPIRIKSTFKPELQGTLVCPDETRNENPKDITGIAGRSDFSRVIIKKAGMNEELGFANRVLSVFASNEICVEHMPSSVDTLSIIFKGGRFAEKKDRICAQLKVECEPDTIEIREHELALIAVVGKKAVESPMIARIVTELAAVSAAIKMINVGSSPISVIVGVPNERLKEAVTVLYRALCV